MEKNDFKILSGFFTDKQNLEIKRELLSTMHKKTLDAENMHEESLDKTVKILRYTLQLYDMTDEMSKKIRQMK
jgi:hypothetical protein